MAANVISLSVLQSDKLSHEGERLAAARYSSLPSHERDYCAVCSNDFKRVVEKTFATSGCLSTHDRNSGYYRTSLYRDRFTRLNPLASKTLALGLLASPHCCPNCCICTPCLRRVIEYCSDPPDLSTPFRLVACRVWTRLMKLGLWHKGVPNAGPFTGDLTVVVCPCGDGHSKLLGVNIMDAGESPRNVKDYLDRLTHCPDYVWYDNSCHLSLMLMSRAPHRYYKLIVMSDNFHVANHTACSVLIAPSQWNHIDRIRNANTEAAEQANAEMVKHLTRSLKFCKPSNALNVLELYMIIMNAKQ